VRINLAFAFSTMALMLPAIAFAQKHQTPVPIGPKLLPCVFDSDRPSICHARILADVVKGPLPLEATVVIRTINMSKGTIFVQDSNVLDDFDLKVQDLWGNPVPLTEKEGKRRSPRSRSRAYLNRWEPVAPSSETVQKLKLSEIFSIAQPGWYTVVVSQVIYRSNPPLGFESILEFAQSAPISFKVDAENADH
jgi:hypothetical protein